jgi:hypothetical protein
MIAGLRMAKKSFRTVELFAAERVVGGGRAGRRKRSARWRACHCQLTRRLRADVAQRRWAPGRRRGGADDGPPAGGFPAKGLSYARPKASPSTTAPRHK